MTSGVYQWVRHPSYFGWSLWSVGTQFILKNPVSIVGFTFACIQFFSDRIPDEEEYLLDFFGDDYFIYALKTPIRIPKVKGLIDYDP